MSVLATALVLGGVAASTAQAMPSPAPIDAAKTSQIVNVDYACGRGWHLTRWGECRPNWRRPPPVAFYGGPPRWGWERRHRDWDGPRWSHERRWDRDRRWRDDD